MTDILYILFYLGVLALVLGCVGYLVVSRNEATLEREGYSLHRVASLHPETHLSHQVLKKAWRADSKHANRSCDLRVDFRIPTGERIDQSMCH